MKRDAYYHKLLRQKSATRGKLMGAISMLLVASVMLSSTTFAWYALSTAPEARGVKTTLAANGNLEIALNHDALDAAYFSADTSDGGVDAIVDRNEYWGNLLELDQADYGLQTVSLKPVMPNYVDEYENSIRNVDPFCYVQYGFDGRGVGLNAQGQLRRFDTTINRFDLEDTYGVRAYCEEYRAPDPGVPSTYDPCAFGIDLLFRTNAAGSNLLLQTSGIDRVYNEGNAPENWYDAYEYEQRQGSGSRVTIENDMIRAAMRVAFTNTLTGELYGIAAPGEDGYLRLLSGSDVLVPLEKNEVIGITAWVYLSGLDIDNSGVDAAEATDLTVNLQFSTDALLYPMMEKLTTSNGLIFVTDESATAYMVRGDTYYYDFSYEGGNGMLADELVIPEKYERVPVVGIADSAFPVPSNYYNPLYKTVKSLVIPASVVFIGEHAFDGCTSLTAFHVDDNNPNFCNDVVGALYNKDKTTLIRCPVGMVGSFTVPDTVTTIEKGAFYGCTGLTEINIPDSVEAIGEEAFYGCKGLISVTVPEGVTEIFHDTFNGCSSLASVSLPNTLTTIGEYAFIGCSSLANITLPNSVTTVSRWAFKGCGLTGVTLSENLKYVTAGMFENCKKLTEVTIPNGTTEIHSSAFKNCSALSKVNIGTGVKRMEDEFIGCTSLQEFAVDSGNSWFCNDSDGVLYNKDKTQLIRCPALLEGAYEIPNSVTEIRYSTFNSCTKLTAVTLPSGVTKIGNYAFRGCTGLAEITIPAGVTKIGYYAFSGCTGLTEITIPAGVTVIDERTFNGCSGLTAVTIPDGVTSIGEYAFNDCSALTAVNIPNTVTAIDSYAFRNCSALTAITIPDSATSVGFYVFNNCSGLTNATLGNGLTSVRYGMFMGCSNLTTVSIPAGAKMIENYAFEGCRKLAAVDIPNGVTTIGMEAFDGCYALTSVVIPDSVTIIQSKAFYYCTGLTSVTLGSSVTSIGDYTFSRTALTSINIPASMTRISDGAFSYSNSLTTVTYDGTKAQWKALINGNTIGLSAADYTIHCTDGTIAKDGTETGA